MWSAEQNIITFLLFPLITGHKLLYLPAICVFFWKWWLFIQGWGIKTKTTDTCTIYPPLWILWLFLLINNCYCSSSLSLSIWNAFTSVAWMNRIIKLLQQFRFQLITSPEWLQTLGRDFIAEINSDNTEPPIINSKEEKVFFTRARLLPGFYFGLARQK